MNELLEALADWMEAKANDRRPPSMIASLSESRRKVDEAEQRFTAALNAVIDARVAERLERSEA